MVCCCWLPTPGWTNKLFIRIIKMLPIMCWKSTKAMSAAVFYDFLCWRGFCRCSVFPSPLSLSGLLNQQNIWSGRQWRRARSWLVTCGSADNTLSPSEHHSAVAHSGDDFWWDASQRSLMGSEEGRVGGGEVVVGAAREQMQGYRTQNKTIWLKSTCQKQTDCMGILKAAV